MVNRLSNSRRTRAAWMVRRNTCPTDRGQRDEPRVRSDKLLALQRAMEAAGVVFLDAGENAARRGWRPATGPLIREGKRGFKATYDSRARTPRQPKSQWDRGFGTASGKSAAASGMWRPFEPKGGTGHRPGSTPDGTKRLSSWVDPTVLVHDGTAHNGAILGCVRWFESYLSSSSPRPVRAWAGLSSGEATVWRPATEHMTRPKSARGRFA